MSASVHWPYSKAIAAALDAAPAFVPAGVLALALGAPLASARASAVVPAGAAASAVPAAPAASPGPALQAAPPTAPIVSGDLIVKFRDASDPGRQLTAVLAGQRSVASVAPLAARLSADLDLPLALVQVTSGREALLALDRTALARALLTRAAREPLVQRSALSGAAAGPAPGLAAGLPASELVLRIELRRGTPAAAVDGLAQRLAAGGTIRPDLQREVGGEAVRLRYDIDALTLAVIARLQLRPDVEYVQANRLLRPASPPPAGASR